MADKPVLLLGLLMLVVSPGGPRASPAKDQPQVLENHPKYVPLISILLKLGWLPLLFQKVVPALETPLFLLRAFPVVVPTCFSWLVVFSFSFPHFILNLCAGCTFVPSSHSASR